MNEYENIFFEIIYFGVDGIDTDEDFVVSKDPNGETKLEEGDLSE